MKVDENVNFCLYEIIENKLRLTMYGASSPTTKMGSTVPSGNTTASTDETFVVLTRADPNPTDVDPVDDST